MEEMRHELGTSIRCDVRWNTMLREDMQDKYFWEFSRCDCIMGSNEYHLFSKSVNYHKNSGVSGGLGQLLDEIHKDKIPGLLRYWKLLKESIWLMMLRFGMHTSYAGLAKVIDEGSESQPCIFVVD